jgi:hypothetical protein
MLLRAATQAPIQNEEAYRGRSRAKIIAVIKLAEEAAALVTRTAMLKAPWQPRSSWPQQPLEVQPWPSV